MERTRFCNLNLTNAFLFGAAMSDPEVMRITLEVLLNRSVKSVTVNAEQTLLFSSESRNIRLDVFAEDEEGIYNVEMQGEDEGNLPKRSRYHQAEMDVMTLKPGEDFNKLKPNIVIFICNFDPFKDKLYQYTFENICHETGKPLGDETWKIFFNIKGKTVGNTPEKIINLLKYMSNTTDECVESLNDENVKQIHKHIAELKRSREWEGKYMRFEELLRKEKNVGHAEGYAEGRAEGRVEGHAEGRTDMLRLIAKMTEAGDADKLSLLSEDADFFDEMCAKYLNLPDMKR